MHGKEKSGRSSTEIRSICLAQKIWIMEDPVLLLSLEGRGNRRG
jgi:hypothetical protein